MDTEHLKQKLNKQIDDASDKIEQAKKELAELSGETKDTLHKMATEIQGHLKDMRNQVASKLREHKEHGAKKA